MGFGAKWKQDGFWVSGKVIGKIDWVATVATLGALLCWSLSPVCIRYIAGSVDSWTQNALRYGVAVLFWLPYLLMVARSGRLEGLVWRRAFWPGVFNVGMQSLWAVTLYYLEPAFFSLLVKTSVVWVALFSMVMFADERRLLRSRMFWASVVLCVVGVLGVVGAQEGFSWGQRIEGVLLAGATAIVWALYAVSVRVTMKGIDSRVSFAVIALYTTVGLAVLMVVLGEPGACWAMGGGGWIAVIVSGVLAIALAHVLFYVAIKRIGTTIPSMMLLSSPFTVLAISWVWFGERLSAGQWVFGLLLVAGAALAILAGANRTDRLTDGR